MSGVNRSVTPVPVQAEGIHEFLQGEGVLHELIEHEPTLNAADEARASDWPPERFAKTIILTDDKALVVVAIPASGRLDLGKLRDALGASRRLQMAGEAEIARRFPGFEVGAVPPFGPMVPAAEVIDSRLLEHEQIACAAGDHRHSVALDPRDVARITAARIADICQD